MGNQRQFNPEGGFTQYLYEKVPKYDTVTINGVKAKVIRETGDTEGHSSLPTYTSTTNVYLKEGKKGIKVRYFFTGEEKVHKLGLIVKREDEK